MTKTDIIRKLTSRKFILAMVAYITSVLTSLNVSDSTIAQVSLIITGIGALIAYIFGEALVDSKNVKQNKDDKEEV